MNLLYYIQNATSWTFNKPSGFHVPKSAFIYLIFCESARPCISSHNWMLNSVKFPYLPLVLTDYAFLQLTEETFLLKKNDEALLGSWVPP